MNYSKNSIDTTLQVSSFLPLNVLQPKIAYSPIRISRDILQQIRSLGGVMGEEAPSLPPLPKLQPRPDLTGGPQVKPCSARLSDLFQDAGDQDDGEEEEEEETCAPDVPVLRKESAEEAKTSRLLTKNDCRGGPGKKSSGSLIHSIPKFSQVAPRHEGGMSQVQKLIQSRLLFRQIQKQQLQQSMKASSILFQLHQRVSADQAHVATQASSTTIKVPSQTSTCSRKRGRKPDKNDICHLVPAAKKHLRPTQDIAPDYVIPVQCHGREEATSIKSLLRPDEFLQLGMPSNYVFWPMANLYLHLSSIPAEYFDATLTTAAASSPAASAQPAPTLRRKRPPEAITRPPPLQTASSCKNAAEVSIGKFKFTGGVKPSLEEKKMVSVDSIHSLRLIGLHTPPDASRPSPRSSSAGFSHRSSL